MNIWRSRGYGAYGDTSKISEKNKKLLIDLVVNTPNLADKTLHDFAVKLGITPDDAEEVIYDYVRRTVRGEKTYIPPLPPPACQLCGKRHAHFVHGSPTSIRGAGRRSKGAPDVLYKLHMTPKEVEGMIYGPMFEKFLKERGIITTHSWEHSPSTPLRDVSRLSGHESPSILGESETMGGAVMKLAATGMTISNFYHGYKRNNSFLWGWLWILTGPIGVALSLAQGYGKPK